MRTHSRKFHLTGCNELIVRVNGDSNNYRHRSESGHAYDEVAYQTVFSTEQDQWTKVRLPFERLQPVSRECLLKTYLCLTWLLV